ncbi:MAG: hypothetical protein QOF00_3281 [Pseudonocardiales bacterium]|nr:hypothetical protein [Pseudonocardiales bacterium]
MTVEVPPRDREVLESWLRAPSMSAGLVRRARIVLLAADGVPVTDIVERVGVSELTVIGWKKRYAAEGIGGLEDRPKLGRRPVIDEVAVVLAALEPPPQLNLVEVFFSIITRQAIRRGSFANVTDLIAAIERFIDGWNDRCAPFVWTKPADDLLEHCRPGQRTSFASASSALSPSSRRSH